MDVIKIQCPNCGASVERKNNEYFGVCDYCGSEVCFDDIKSEAEVADLRGQVNTLDRRIGAENEYKQKLAAWEKKRNRMYIITGAMSFVGFLLAALSVTEDDAFIVLGVTLLLGAVIGLTILSIYRTADCPKPTDPNAPRKGGFFRIFGTGALILSGAAFLSVIFAVIFCGV